MKPFFCCIQSLEVCLIGWPEKTDFWGLNLSFFGAGLVSQGMALLIKFWYKSTGDHTVEAVLPGSTGLSPLAWALIS